MYARIMPASLDLKTRIVMVAEIEILESPSATKSFGFKPDESGQPYMFKSITYLLTICGNKPVQATKEVCVVQLYSHLRRGLRAAAQAPTP